MTGFKESLGSKRVVVLGGGRSGISAVGLLNYLGSKVFLSEKNLLNYRVREQLYSMGVQYEEGRHTERVLQSHLVVSSPGVPLKSWIIKRTLDTNIPLIGELELGYRFLKGRVCAITGTNGKSTVTAWIGHIIKTKKTFISGNIGYPLSSFYNREGLFIVEVSSFQLATISDFRADIAVYLNFDQDHLDWHRDIEEYRKSKERIFENQRKGDKIVLNWDDKNLRDYEGNSGVSVYYFSVETPVRGAYIEEGWLTINTEGQKRRLLPKEEVSLKGLHNMENALATSLTSYLLGAGLEEIKSGLRGFRGLPYRMEYIDSIKGTVFINDSKSTNPHSTLWALKSLEDECILIMGGEDKGLDFKDLIPILREKVRFLVIIGEAKEKLRRTFNGITEVREENSLTDAVRTSFLLSKGALPVLFSPGCSSFDMFKDFKDRGDAFRDAVSKLKER